MTHESNAEIEREHYWLANETQRLIQAYWLTVSENERVKVRHDDEAWAFTLETMRRKRAQWAEEDARLKDWRGIADDLRKTQAEQSRSASKEGE